MGRWTQFEEDSYRLPEGMKRVAYDADTARYTFRDRDGRVYVGPSGEDYGVLTLVSGLKKSKVADRPHAFASESSKPNLNVHIQPASTFQDILPAHLITSPSSAESTSLPAGMSTGSRLRDVVRRTAMPAMQNVANNVRRSATLRKPTKAPRDEDKEGLLSRSVSSVTSSTLVSRQSMEKAGYGN
ncbi:hypothetical protein C8J57DRAFT_1368246 [Mycena rebaudengoi]|nr:hypothetical protein C8J57DRAFT_1368246 [Mycena rebaudengoi]